ncbi:MAG: DUF5711 family protein [Clostridiales bacterium]|nr:DUF5711 family protein [Clostridiales bacterium]
MAKKNPVLWAVSAILSIILLINIYANRNEIFFGRDVNRGGKNIIYKIDGALQRNFAIYKKMLLINTNQDIKAIDKRGNLVWAVDFPTKNPMINVNGNYALVVDRDGTEFMAIKNGKILTHGNVGSEIFTGKINANGYIALASEEDGFKCKVTVYNEFGDEIYKWKISDNYVLDCEVSPNGKQIVAAMVSTSDEKIFGSLAFVDIIEKKIIERPSFVNCIFSSVRYNKNNNVLAIADTAALYFDKDGKILWNKNFDGRTLQSYAFPEGKNIVLFFKNGRNTSTLESYGLNGEKKNAHELDFDVSTVSVNGGVISAAGIRDLATFTFSGKSKITLALTSDIRWQGLLPDGKNILVVHGNNVDVITP